MSAKLYSVLLLVVLSSITICAEDKTENKAKPEITELRIGIKKRVPPEECTKKAQKGDSLSMHYTGTLYSDGSKFDSSLDRSEPFTFTLGSGQVIAGWDKGLVGMCVGEKRRLVIPSKDGYGDHGSPPKIPGKATLVFEVELLKIDRNDEL